MNSLNEISIGGLKVNKCNLFDPNIDDLFCRYAVYPTIRYKAYIYESKNLYRLEIVGFNSQMNFSVNISDKISFTKNRVDFQDGKFNFHDSDDQTLEWFLDIENKQLITSLLEKSKECVAVYKNAIMYYLYTIENIEDKLQKLQKLVRRIEAQMICDKYMNFSIENIPEEFHQLIPYIQRWSISDDIVRENVIAATDTTDKIMLVEIGWPLLENIDNYLSKFKEPLPYEAVLLGDLAQSIREIKAKN